MTQFRTSISEVGEGTVNLRGYSLDDVIRHLDHTDGIFLTILGRLPSPAEHEVTRAMLNTLLDHGWVASTVAATRYAASGNPQLVPALAAGLLACGNNTVSPQHSFDVLEQARVLRESLNLTFEQAAERIIDEFRASRKRLPGLGHPTHKTEDFRAVAIWQIADRVGAAGDGIRQFRAIHARFVEASGRFLPVNIDGALAALGYDLGWTATQTVAIGLLSVLPGLMAHAIEELENPVPLRCISDGVYDVKSISELPVTLEESAK
ncbi:MAG: citrate/2-methylcitrate synthase [Mycobacterium sp.]|jgi:citrate synthase